MTVIIVFDGKTRSPDVNRRACGKSSGY